MSDLQSILEDLAAGRISADEASRRIDSLDRDDRPGGPEKVAEPTDEELAGKRDPGPDAGFRGYAPPPPPKGFGPEERRTSARPSGSKGVERLEIRASSRRVRLIGDPGVSTVSIDGPHVLRRNGKVLEITSEGQLTPSLDGFSLLRTRSLHDLRVNTFGGKELAIRVNPSLLIDAELSGGMLTTMEVPYLGKVRVTAGGARINGAAEISDALIQAGQATIKGTFRSGRSRIRFESGQGSIELGDESNVTIRSEAHLGKVAWAGAHSGEGAEVVMGHGNARLDVEAMMAYVTVRVGEGETA
ncbi:hypothetical protein ACQBAU_04800 [Propionibacteriaceae bacterium Y2011]|uniref:hypothetical protein n=1 Tax=Microlunatus sp. Y2014 TaxID=3418488 RepID=UPI003B43E55C